MLTVNETLILVVLIIIVLVSIVATYRYKKNLNNCINNEGPYCPCFTCRDGKPAQRVGGSVQNCGVGSIAP